MGLPESTRSQLTTLLWRVGSQNLEDGQISLSFADLICSVIIVPLSIYSSLSPNWNFMGNNSLVCRSAAYVHVVIVSSTAYTCAWVGVDRYSAFMKPARYEIEHTLTRCKCWIAFSWATAILLAFPMIVAKMEINYHNDLEMCVLNWRTTMAYSITLAVLVLLPLIFTVIITCGSVFAALRRPEQLEDSQRTAVETDENFIVTFFVLVALILVWLPIIMIELLPESFIHIHPVDLAKIRFIFLWLAIGGSSVKLLIFTFANHDFRRSLCSFCVEGRRRKRKQRCAIGAGGGADGDRVIGELFEAAALGAHTAGNLTSTSADVLSVHEENMLIVGGSGGGSDTLANNIAANYILIGKNNINVAGTPNSTAFSSPYRLPSYSQIQQSLHNQHLQPQRKFSHYHHHHHHAHGQHHQQQQLQLHPRQFLSPQHQRQNLLMGQQEERIMMSCRALPKSTASSPITRNLMGHIPEYGSFSRPSMPIYTYY